MLCYAMLCYAVLCCAYAVQRNTVPCCAVHMLGIVVQQVQWDTCLQRLVQWVSMSAAASVLQNGKLQA